MRKRNPGILLRNNFWKAAKAYDAVTFTEAMEEIKKLDEDVWGRLKKIHPSHWCRHAFEVNLRGEGAAVMKQYIYCISKLETNSLCVGSMSFLVICCCGV